MVHKSPKESAHGKTPTEIHVSLPVTLRTRVLRHATDLAKVQGRIRVPLSEAILHLVKIGLASVEAQRRDTIQAVLRDFDPGWSGARLDDLEPVRVSTKKNPVKIILDRK